MKFKNVFSGLLIVVVLLISALAQANSLWRRGHIHFLAQEAYGEYWEGGEKVIIDGNLTRFVSGDAAITAGLPISWNRGIQRGPESKAVSTSGTDRKTESPQIYLDPTIRDRLYEYTGERGGTLTRAIEDYNGEKRYLVRDIRTGDVADSSDYPDLVNHPRWRKKYSSACKDRVK